MTRRCIVAIALGVLLLLMTAAVLLATLVIGHAETGLDPKAFDALAGRIDRNLAAIQGSLALETPPVDTTALTTKAPAPAPQDVPVLRGVVWNAERPLAFIDDGVFAKGDLVGRYTVVEVREDSATLTDGDGKKIKLELYE